jgi:hypothetical protein
MRKVAILVICLLSTSCAGNIANSQPKPLDSTSSAANAAPSDYRAQVVRQIQMSQAYDVKKIHDAGITPPVFKSVSIFHGTRWLVCVATFEDAIIKGTIYRLAVIGFKNGQAEILSITLPKGQGSPSRMLLNVVASPCQGLKTSPLPEIVRGKPLS